MRQLRHGLARYSGAANGSTDARAGLLSLRPTGSRCLLEVWQVLLLAACQQLDVLDGPGILRGLL
jgi:hypothetical protein